MSDAAWVLTGVVAAILGASACATTSVGMCRDGHDPERCWDAMHAPSMDERTDGFHAAEHYCLTTTPSRGRTRACVLAAQVLTLDPDTTDSRDGELRRLVGAPNPGRAAELLRSVCQPADYDRDACQLLAALSWVGFGVPRDRVLGRAYAMRAAEADVRFSARRLEPGTDLRLLEAILPRLSADSVRTQLLQEVREHVEKKDLDGAVEPFLTLVALRPRVPGFTVSEAGEAWVALADQLWDTAVSREIAAGRLGVGVGRASFIGRQLFDADPSRLSRVDDATNDALRRLAAVPRTSSVAGRKFRQLLARSLAGKDEKTGPPAPPPPFDPRHALPRWQFHARAPACQWLVDLANKETARRTGPTVVVTLDDLVCDREDRRWSTTETYTDTVWSGGTRGTKAQEVRSRWAACPGYSATHDMCLVEETVETEEGGTAPAQRQIQATREVRHRLFRHAMRATPRVQGGHVIPWTDEKTEPEETVHVGGEGPQDFNLAHVLRLVEEGAAASLVIHLDTAITMGEIRLSDLPHAVVSPDDGTQEGVLFEQARFDGVNEADWQPLLVKYGIRPWHFRSLAVGSGAPVWLYGLDDPPPR